MNFQLISILAMLCDPLTKGLLGRFGSASMVGYYEMANRLVQQFRSIIVNANQVLVPAFAHIKELEPEKIRIVYLKSYRLLFFISMPLFSTLIIGAPVISELWIGRNESAFITPMIILSIGWFINTLCVPAYYAGLGTGELRWNVISHGAMAILNIGLGFILGQRFGGLGVIAGWALALAMGGIILGISFHKHNQISIKEFLPSSSRWLTVSCIGGILFSYLLFHNASSSISPILIGVVMIIGFACILAVPVWIHPARKEFSEWFCSLRGKSAVVQ
jgi:O-antigen/teichoic acid export membrane protein